MSNAIKAPSKIKSLITDEDRRNGRFYVRIDGVRKEINFSDIPDDLMGNIVCVKNRGQIVTTNGWYYWRHEKPKVPYLKIDYPKGSESDYKIFKLEKDLLFG